MKKIIILRPELHFIFLWATHIHMVAERRNHEGNIALHL